MIVVNSFSINMLADYSAFVNFKEISPAQAALELARVTCRGDHWSSAVGHADTAAVMTAALQEAAPEHGIVIPCNRATVQLHRGDRALVGQYSGPRLQEGATKLPEGATIRWVVAHIL